MNTTTATPAEFETYTETIKAGAAREGDMITSDPAMRRIRKVKAATKWTELRTEDGTLILRTLSDSDIEVYRERETEASRNRRSREAKNARLLNAAAEHQPQSNTKKALEALNERVAAGCMVDHWLTSRLLDAQAEDEVLDVLFHLVNERATDPESATDAVDVLEAYKTKLMEQMIGSHDLTSGLSRSTSMVSNLMNDAKREAIARFLNREYLAF
jgi:hypothetical protein